MKKLLLCIAIGLLCISCDGFEAFFEQFGNDIEQSSPDNKDEEGSDTLQPIPTFRSVKGELGGCDELLYSDSTYILYKESERGLPDSMIIYTNGVEEEFVEAVFFDERGIPEYFNINGKSVYVSNVRGELCDLLFMHSDGTFSTLPDCATGIDIANYWAQHPLTRAGSNGRAVAAVNMANKVLGARSFMQGSFDMGLGAFGMMWGCAMLIPGCNVVMGTTLMIAGAATFIAGSMEIARATDLLVSDGTHTDGAYATTSEVLNIASNMTGSGIILKTAINLGFNKILNDYDKRAQELERVKQAKHFVSTSLVTSECEIDYINRNVTLSGSLSAPMGDGDKIGLYISEDPSALHVVACSEIPAQAGKFSRTFDNLERCKSYFYRAYYYSQELQQTFIAKPKEFYIPGIKTSGYTKISDNNYNVFVEALLGEQLTNVDIGVCYSSSNKEPVVDDDYSELQTISRSDNYTCEITPDELPCYYRAFMIIDDKYVTYGEPATIHSSDREILIQFYHDTGGDNWTRNDNWCSDKPLYEWYGVNMGMTDENGIYHSNWFWIDLQHNNLTGSGSLAGCTNLYELYCYNNSLTSLDVTGCTNLYELYCYNNSLTSLDISGCTNLCDLYCSNNSLTSLDVTGCTKLYTLICYNNSLTSLNVSRCTNLEYLGCCDNNSLTSLNVSGCTNLRELYCYNNSLTSLDVRGCSNLDILDCHNNSLTSLDISGCTNLEWLYCDNNPITQVLQPPFTNIHGFDCDRRYEYDYDENGNERWRYRYSDGHGWYEPGEPYGIPW
ncbi:MAG: leucine-rich repeat domain-containing protein [Rikenellaceae bacterium]|nr:leucine-rich repeat domain-containing protein [Rikenellaceae bacterium]